MKMGMGEGRHIERLPEEQPHGQQASSVQILTPHVTLKLGVLSFHQKQLHFMKMTVLSFIFFIYK